MKSQAKNMYFIIKCHTKRALNYSSIPICRHCVKEGRIKNKVHRTKVLDWSRMFEGKCPQGMFEYNGNVSLLSTREEWKEPQKQLIMVWHGGGRINHPHWRVELMKSIWPKNNGNLLLIDTKCCLPLRKGHCSRYTVNSGSASGPTVQLIENDAVVINSFTRAESL